jgi:hypothetical protein
MLQHTYVLTLQAKDLNSGLYITVRLYCPLLPERQPALPHCPAAQGDSVTSLFAAWSMIDWHTQHPDAASRRRINHLPAYLKHSQGLMTPKFHAAHHCRV